MKHLSAYIAAAEAVDVAYLEMTDPDAAPWPRHLVMLLLGFVAGSGSERGRYVDMAVRAILTLPVDVRDTLMSEYRLPHPILAGLENPPSWPEPVAIEGWTEALGVDIEQSRILALKRIEDLGYRTRVAFLTKLPGQSDTYRRKEDQARAYVAATDKTDLSPYGLVAEEASLTGQTPDAVAAAVIARADATYAAELAFEPQRVAAQKAVREAASLEDIAAAETAFQAVCDGLMAQL